MATVVKITPNENGNPPGKLAEAELHFGDDHVLAGLKLIGFAVWSQRTGTARNVTFPARQYAVNGERRSFALLRPVSDVAAQNRLRELILEAYRHFEETERTEYSRPERLTSAADAQVLAAAEALDRERAQGLENARVNSLNPANMRGRRKK